MSDTAKRDAVLDRYSGGGWDVPDHDAMAWRIVRLERILAALREPSANVIESANIGFPFAAPMIRAAVAAAEQEVGRE